MTQSYESTRNENLKASSSMAVLDGIASDGGLYVMRNLDDKKINLENLQNENYISMANKIIGCMLDDYPKDKIAQCVESAYTNKFTTEEITPVVKVGNNYVTELFHGPTSAFKDVALSILPHLMTASYEMNHTKKEVIILTATSGDTGKAALEGFKDVKGTKIIVFYPDKGVSEVQRCQMVTQEGTNTYVCAIEGNFDDAQRGVKNMFTDEELIKKLKDKDKIFSSANSINIGRLIPQIVYYFYSYMKLVEKGNIKMNDKINFAVPTGNFGNILAGYYAKILGLPVNKLLCGSNENNVLYDFIKTGEYDTNRTFHKTISPSMDILVSSNIERLLYFISDKNNETVKNLMKKLNENGRYEVNSQMKSKLHNEFYASCVFETETKQTIKEVYERQGYLMDTHTAVAYKTLENYQKDTGDDTMSVVLSTASPFKFSNSVYESLYGETSHSEFETMYELSQKTGVEIPNNLKGLENKKVLHEEVCKKEEMDKVINRCILINVDTKITRS